MLNNKTVAAMTLGCKVNQYETDGMLELLKSAGAKIVDFDKKADIYLINTCSVTNIADKKSRQMIHRAKKQNPDAIVVAAGCYVQAERKTLEQDPSVDLIVSNNRKKEIAGLLEQYLCKKTELNNFADIGKEREFEGITISKPINHTRAYVKIQDGCNQFCSYCIIPYVRGRIRSREPVSVEEEVRRLAEAGVKEIVLTGIHVSSYGKDKENGMGLTDLINKVSKIEPIKRVRLGSLEPGIITPAFIAELAENEKVCPHFHLSLQSGCDTVLKRMNRKYTCEDYMEKCDMLRRAYDRPAITTDVITGFPGETEEEFEQTAAFLKQMKLYELHVFKYSPRKGTVAAAMDNQVPPEIKSERSDRLLALSAKCKADYEASFANEDLTVLVEEQVRAGDAVYYRGYTERYMDVRIPGRYIPDGMDPVNRLFTVCFRKRKETGEYEGIPYIPNL